MSFSGLSNLRVNHLGDSLVQFKPRGAMQIQMKFIHFRQQGLVDIMDIGSGLVVYVRICAAFAKTEDRMDFLPTTSRRITVVPSRRSVAINEGRRSSGSWLRRWAL